MDGTDWMEAAACRQPGVDRSWFFPPAAKDGEPNTDAGRVAVEKAKTVCRSCPVFDACQEYALHERHGVWFGTTPRERRKLRGRRVARVLPPKLCGNRNCPTGTFIPDRESRDYCSRSCARSAERDNWANDRYSLSRDRRTA